METIIVHNNLKETLQGPIFFQFFQRNYCLYPKMINLSSNSKIKLQFYFIFQVIDSSSHDTEDDRLWASPRIGSNTLVQDIERGVSLLKGVMENKSASRRSKRELIRRIVKRLVTSEYVEDLVERERTRYRARSPFSPRVGRT